MAQRRSASWQVGGEAMHSLLYPVCNEREAMRRQGLKPKNHAKENMRRIGEMQQQNMQVTKYRRYSSSWCHCPHAHSRQWLCVSTCVSRRCFVHTRVTAQLTALVPETLCQFSSSNTARVLSGVCPRCG